MTGIHQDVKTLEISSPYKKTYTITPDGTLSGGETELKTKYDTGWQPVKENGAEFVGDKNNRFVGIVTDVRLSEDLTSFTLSLVDEYGLSTSVTASTQASELPSVTASPTGGIITINGTVVFSNPVPGAILVLESDNWYGVKRNDTEVSGNIEGAGPITLTFTEPRTYNITAYAQKSGAADSDKVIFTYKVVDDSTVYVSDTGDDSNPGTENKPVATLQRALDLLNEARFTEGKIVVTGTVQTEEVKINAPGGSTTESVTTLTVMGGSGSAGGTLENKNGRVFTIGTGGSLTLGENITLTGTNDIGNGGAVYVNGGTFTMEDGSKITGSSAIYGGGVYVDSTGTFTMGGGTISKNSASSTYSNGDGASGGGVCISDGTFTMSGGAVISGNTAFRSGGGVFVSGSGDFTMKGGTIGGTGGGSPNSAENGGGVYIHNGTFTMSGGAVISGNSASSSSSSGGGVYIFEGTFTMCDSAVISGNSATSSGGGVYVYETGEFTMEGGTIGGTDGSSDNSSESGGGVCVYKGDFTMSDGSISGNTVAQSGGGVFVQEGTFTMEGGAVISGNSASSSSSSGGGVYIFEGTFTMMGGTIGGTTANTAEYGGGVCVDGTSSIFFMHGNGTITKNNANLGGGVYVGDGTFIMYGGTLSENTATQNGGGVCVDGTSSNFFMHGNGTITKNNATLGGGVYVGSSSGSFEIGELSAASSPVVSGNTKTGSLPNNVYLDTGKTLSITGELIKKEESGNIGITMATPGEFTSDWSKSCLKDTTFFFSDDESYKIELDSTGECKLVTNDSQVKYEVSGITRSGTFAEAVDAVNTAAGGTITLLKNIDGSNAVFGASNNTPITFTGGTEASHVILDLNGCTIDRELGTAQADGTVISVSGALTLKDSTGSGKITGGNNNNSTISGTWGGGVCVQDGAFFTMEGGNISCNFSGIGGGGVYVCNGGSFTMTGGTIGGSGPNDGNMDTSTSYGGGGVFVNGKFTMSSGTITRNITGANGGGVAVTADGTFTMSGTAVISVNEASGGSGGGVYSAADFTMTGGTISSNTATDGGGVYMINSKKITMDGGAISDNIATTNGGGLYLYDGSTAEIGKNTSGSAPQISNNAATNDGTAGNDNAGGGIYLAASSSVEFTRGTISSNTVGESTGSTSSQGGGVYIGRGSTFIMDGESAIIENNKINSVIGAGGGIYSEGGTLEMKNGSITGNNAGGSGGGVYVSSATFTMTDGEISRNYASSGGGVTVGSAGTFIISSPAVVSGNTISSVGGSNVYVSTGGKFIDDDNCVTEGVEEQQ